MAAFPSPTLPPPVAARLAEAPKQRKPLDNFEAGTMPLTRRETLVVFFQAALVTQAARFGLAVPAPPLDEPEIFQPERFKTSISGLRWVKRGAAVFVEGLSEEAEDSKVCLDGLFSADEFFKGHDL
jgi:hypothetical protein